MAQHPHAPRRSGHGPAEHVWLSDSPPGLDHRGPADSPYRLFAATYGVIVNSAEQTPWGESAAPAEHVVSRNRGDRGQLHLSSASVTFEPDRT